MSVAAETVYDALKRRFGNEPEGDYACACWHFQKARALRAEAARFEGDRPPFDWIEPESDWLCRLAEMERSLARFYRGLWQDTQPPRWARKRLREAARSQPQPTERKP